MSADFEDLWKIDPRNATKGRTWHWWWWLFFFKNETRPKRPRQLMLMWGTRNCREATVDNFHWVPPEEQKVFEGESRAEYDSIVAAWYFDGSKMRHPLILESGPTQSAWGGGTGSVIMKTEQARHSFSGSDGNFRIESRNEDADMAFDISPWTQELAKLVRTGKNFAGKYGYSMLKYRGLRVKGKISLGGMSEEVSGRAYFQKVRITLVTPAWYWGTMTFGNGAYMQYFLPHLGIPNLRQGLSHESGLDWGGKMVSRTLNFYNPATQREYLMKDVTVAKRYESDLPVFTVKARDGSAELSAELAAYSRCCWRIRQPLLAGKWFGIFYNEYPSEVLSFKFRDGSETMELADMGDAMCNTEHSWGFI